MTGTITNAPAIPPALQIQGDTYTSPPASPGLLARLFPSLVFYPGLFGIIWHAAQISQKGTYTGEDWSYGSLSVLHLLEKVGVHIHADGINNVKIFCYDVTILKSRQRHRINFIFHDSRLFDGIDERQKGIMFQLVGEQFLSSQDQYIASLNENQYNELKQILPADDFARIIDRSITMTLTDESPAAKLLGCQLDLPYDQRHKPKLKS